MYARKIFTINPGHKIYQWISVRSTRHHTLLHNPPVLNTKTFFAPAFHPRKIYRCMTAQSTRHHTLLHNPTILHTKIIFAPACHPHQKVLPISRYESKTNLSRNISLFPSLGLGFGLGLRSNKPLTCNWYISLHVTTLVAYYFYFHVLCKHYHTHEDGGVLNNTYYSQVLHSRKDGSVLGTPIQYSQCDIPLRESRIRLHL